MAWAYAYGVKPTIHYRHREPNPEPYPSVDKSVIAHTLHERRIAVQSLVYFESGQTVIRILLSALENLQLTHSIFTSSQSSMVDNSICAHHIAIRICYLLSEPQVATVATSHREAQRRFDEAFVYDTAERVNTVFGGLRPDVNNTINIHGYIDPWRALGVYEEDLKESSPTYTVARASHCFDMLGELQTDTIRMAQVKQIARRMVARWLSS
ncbi:hypothetical protein evm_010530 [Chilo suppressalis]|nr:hypothetical protein evm_010530 [Chilo suppressalis]